MKSASQFLEYLTTTYSKLHTAYEEAFWISHMGDDTYTKKMHAAAAKRDAFRGDAKLKQNTEELFKKTKGPLKARLGLWKHFFELYQTPPEAAAIRKEIAELESQIQKIRSTRKEGYIDPATKKFIEASEIKMRVAMRTNPEEAVRKACFEAIEKLPLDTIDLYVELIKLRNSYAQKLGHSDFYAYKARIDEDMTKKELFSIFEKIYEKTKYAFDNVRALEKTMPGLRKPWNYAYMLTGNFTQEEDPYFRFENVLSYWGRSFAALGLNLKGGTLQLDLLDRKGKYNNGFCHYPKLVGYKGSKFIPGQANFTSNAIPTQMGSGAQGIHTVFHEGGHAFDRLNSTQRDACVNTEYPPSTVSWAETHSMFMDHICSSIEWRIRYAKNDKGQPYPFDIFERKLKKVHVIRPLDMMSIISVVMFEKEIYECKGLTSAKVLEIARKNHAAYWDRSEDSLILLNIPHIYSFESSAYYHGYGLALLAVEQWREYFFKKYGYIVDNPNVGKEMTKIWSYASAYPAKTLVKMATGKTLSAGAYIRDVTLSAEAILKNAKAKVERLKKVPLHKKPVNLGGRIIMVSGKKKIADNSKSFEDMDRKYRAWLKTVK